MNAEAREAFDVIARLGAVSPMHERFQWHKRRPTEVRHNA